MILPAESMPNEDPLAGLAERVDAFFKPGGGLERGCAGEDFPYEPRPQQNAMAVAVAGAVAERRHLAVEAGTGVGKSFAYLAPLVLAAVASGRKAVVATHTISLQEQLIRKDLPFLRQHLGVDFIAELVKGKGNYLCLRRLARTRSMGGGLLAPDEMPWIHRLAQWAAHTEEGSMQDLPSPPPGEVWSAVCVEEGNCLHRKCPEFERCFFFRARARAHRAHLLVANHHLLFADLALREQDVALLPDYEVLVLDEAHSVEEVAGQHFGLRLSAAMFDHWMRRLHRPGRERGLLALLRDAEGVALLDDIFGAQEQLFASLESWAAFDQHGNERRVPAPPAVDTRLPALLGRMSAHLRDAADAQDDVNMQAEIRQAGRRALALRDALADFLEQRLDDQVYWLAREGRRAQTVMYTAPIEVAPLLRKRLFEALPCVVMTSATLAVNDSLDYFLHRIGAEGLARGERHGSPFDYARQMRVRIPRNMPDPTATGYEPALARAILALVVRENGGTLVLFTNAAAMRRVAGAVREDLEVAGLRLLVQGEGGSRSVLLDDFRRGEGAVLFGLDSFWVGVDVRGPSLRQVIITRLPFAVPDHPLIRARMDRIAERGGDPFREYSLPEAVIQFRQGAGRLIRTAEDTGAVVVLDRRVVDKWYGRWFMRSLPECPVEWVDTDGDDAPEALDPSE